MRRGLIEVFMKKYLLTKVHLYKQFVRILAYVLYLMSGGLVRNLQEGRNKSLANLLPEFSKLNPFY